MSGYARGRMYQLLSVMLHFIALAATIAMVYLFFRGRTIQIADIAMLLAFIVVQLVLPINVLLHELGHVLAGWAVNMSFLCMIVGHWGFFRMGKRFRYIRANEFSGDSEMLPKGSSHMRLRLCILTAGGAALNLIYGTVFIALFFCLPPSVILFFFALFAPINILEGLMALIPAQLPSGKTDGFVLMSLLRRRSDGEALVILSQALGILYHGQYGDIPPALIAEAPIVAADDACYFPLLRLQWQWAYSRGDGQMLSSIFSRLKFMLDDLTGEAKDEAVCDLILAQHAAWIGKEEFQLPDGISEGEASVAYLRAAALCGLGSERERLVLSAKAQIKRIPARGMRQLEEELMLFIK